MTRVKVCYRVFKGLNLILMMRKNRNTERKRKKKIKENMKVLEQYDAYICACMHTYIYTCIETLHYDSMLPNCLSIRREQVINASLQ